VSWSCAKTAQIEHVSGPGYINIYGRRTPTGAKWHGDAMQRNHFYELHNVQVTVNYGGATEILSGGAIVMLTCAGKAAGDPLDVPNIEMLKGTDVVHATKATAATVSDEEGLFGPIPGSDAMVYRVHRSLTDDNLTLEAALAWYDDSQFQPTGTTKAKSKSAPRLNVTPYVGKDPGSCRHVDHAVLVTDKSYGQGTAVYDG
jgi:hypothetical protein